MIPITDYEAKGDGEQLNTAAIQSAIDACAKAGGGLVLVPSGCFLCGPLELKDNVHLYLEPGAVLKAMRDIGSWPLIGPDYSGKTTTAHSYQPFIYAKEAENIGVSGFGTIDGSGEVWWQANKQGNLQYRRPCLLAPEGCVNVTVCGVRLLNSPCWTLNPVSCDNVSIEGVTVLNPPHSPNTDGINPDSCRYVRISGCHIDVGDDCVTLKSGTENGNRPAEKSACENITITNCTMVHGHGGVVCGSEMSGNVRNVTISNCVFKGTDRGLRFKTRRGRGGIIENVRVNNIIMEDVQTPFIVNLFYNCGARGEAKIKDTHAYPVDAGTPRIERLRFCNITARNAHFAAGVLYGLPEMPVRDIVFDDVDINMNPDAEAGMTASAATLPAMKKRAFFARHVSGLRMRDTKVDGYEGPFLDQENCDRIKIDD